MFDFYPALLHLWNDADRVVQNSPPSKDKEITLNQCTFFLTSFKRMGYFMILLRGESVVEKHRVTILYSHTDCAHLGLVPGSPSAQTHIFLYCKRWKAGRGLGTRLDVYVKLKLFCLLIWTDIIAVTTHSWIYLVWNISTYFTVCASVQCTCTYPKMSTVQSSLRIQSLNTAVNEKKSYIYHCIVY